MRLSPSVVLLRTQSDERLTALAGEGSEPAFTALVERYRRPVLRACTRVLPESRAEDAAQQTFLAAWDALRRGDDVRDVRAWLLKIARNTSLNALRAPGFEYAELVESLEGGSAPQAELERREVVRQTLTGLAALPDNQREALLRNAVAGVPHAEIARDLGLSDGATRQLVLRARATLRAAASALTPLPLVTWAASGGTTVGGAFAAKAVTVAIVGGSVVAAPVVISRDGKEPARAQAAETQERTPAPRRNRAAATVAPLPDRTATATPTSAPARAAAARTAVPARTQSREQAADRREDTVDDTRDRQEDAADEAQDQREDAVDEQEDALEEQQEVLEELAEERVDNSGRDDGD